MRASLTLAVLVFSASVSAEPTVEPVVTLEHVSHITRGAPFNDNEEFQSELIAAGVTITAGRRDRWEIDIVHGVQRVERAAVDSASKLNVRFYPRRNRS